MGVRIRIPPIHDFLNWNRVKGRVDLDVIEMLRIPAQASGSGKLRWIPVAYEFRISPT